MTKRRQALWIAVPTALAEFAVNAAWQASRGRDLLDVVAPSLLIAVLIGAVAYGSARYAAAAKR